MSTKHFSAFVTSSLAKSLVLTCGLVIAPMMSTASAESARMATYDAAGQACFALSVVADVKSDAATARHLAIVVDTSASQAGPYREEAIASLTSLLNGLGAKDRVQLFAADLELVPLNDAFAAAKSTEIESAIAKLRARAPLGATDMAGIFTAAAKSLVKSPINSRRIVYIGDGMSKAKLLPSKKFQKVIDTLKSHRASVSSIAVGPLTNVSLLAALANHTGGNVVIAAEKISGQQLGNMAAKAALAAVAWPTSVDAPKGWTEAFPVTFPPLRDDRDSIVVGSFKRSESGTLQVNFDVDGRKVTREWDIKAEPSSEDFAYLPKLLELARKDKGVFLPTAGSPALREVRRMLMTDSKGMSSLAEHAFQSGNLQGAKTLADAALESDPGNTSAEFIRDALERRQLKPQTKLMQFEGTVDEDGPLVLDAPSTVLDDPAPVAPAVATDLAPAEVVPAQATGPVIIESGIQPIPEIINEPAPMIISNQIEYAPAPIIEYAPAPIVEYAPIQYAPVAANVDRAEFVDRDAKFLDEAEQRSRARTGALKVEVKNSIAAAREIMGQSPDNAVEHLKMLLETIRRSNDVSAEVRAQLNDQVQSATRSAQREVINFNVRQAEIAERQAIAAERTKILAAMRRNEVRTLQIMDRFNSLMDEGRYVEAEEVAFEAEKLQPNNTTHQVAILSSRMAGRVRFHERVRDLSERGAVKTWQLVREAAIPTPDEPALTYPDAEFWQDISTRRAKYKSIDLAAPGSAEARIFASLDEVSPPLDFADTSLTDVIQALRDNNEDMNIVLDDAALDAAAVDPETPINKQLNGVTLRSALRLILKGLDLTYIVKDEVLLITTLEEAEIQLVTKVYPVADLVMPIQSGGGMGGMMGGMGGMMGGGMGGMGGGMGGMGGGMGGMGGGMGGMGGGMGGGGMFAVEDTLRLGAKAKPQAPAATAQPAPAPAAKATRPGKEITVKPTSNQTARDAWHTFFQQQVALPAAKRATDADVRQTVRVRMNDRKFSEASAVIQSALASGFAQPWMYEALGLAMQANEQPKSEIERALMSSVDLAESMDELYYAATYMSRIGLDERALSLLEQVAAANPTRPEPYAMALQVAQRIQDVEALRWSCTGILSHAWPVKLQAIEQEAKRSAKATLARLLKEQNTAEAEEFRFELNDALVRDCTIDVTWSGEADIDLLIQEPGGSICSLQTPRTNGGGVLLGDASSELAKSSTITESYVCPKGQSGKYKLMLRPIWGQVAAGKVNVKVTTHAGTSGEQVIERLIELGDEPSLVVFDLDKGRLEQPLEDHMVQTAAHKQIAVNRSVLAQQIDQDSSDLIGELAFDRAIGLLPRANRAVGFRPVITSLPEGTSMSATAIVSADRRYVRVSPSPTFSSVTRVDTFNFVSGTGENVENNQGGGLGGNLGGGNAGVGSDRRLKKNIVHIGQSPAGLNIYTFEYKDTSFGAGVYQGVMSDEIPQAAVIKHDDGYDRVDYRQLDVEFKLVK